MDISHKNVAKLLVTLGCKHTLSFRERRTKPYKVKLTLK